MTSKRIPDMPLVEFISQEYIPNGKHDAPRLGKSTLRSRCNSIDHNLRCALQREPVVSDLNGETLAKLLDFLKRVTKRSEAYRWQLNWTFRAIWRHAIEAGILPASQEAMAKPRQRVQNPKPDGTAWHVSDAPGTLWHVCLNEFFPRNLRIRSKKTVHNYKTAFRSFTEFLGRDPVLSDLTDDNAMGMMRQMRAKGRAPKTCNEHAGRLHTLWEWLARRRIVEAFPGFGKFPEPKRIPKAWSTLELDRLFAACRNAPGRLKGRIPASEFWMALHLVLWDSGERIEATLACQWDWLDTDTGRLRIPAEARKAQDSDAEYTLHPTTLAWVEKLRGHHPSLIFCGLNIVTLYSGYTKLRKRAGLAIDGKSAFHRMRRSVASHLHANGHDATEALHHSSARVTRRSYLDPAIVGTVRPSELLFRPESNPVRKPDKKMEPADAEEALAWL